MFGFGRKKSTTSGTGIQATVAVQTIPEIFYGGQDPEIYKSQETAIRVPNQATGGRPLIGAAVPSSRRRLLIAFAGFLFLLMVTGISWYYLRDYRRAISAPPAEPALPAAEESAAASPLVPELTVTTTESVETVTTTETAPTVEDTPASLLAEPPILFPPQLSLTTLDLDNDTLTDREEEALGTDSGVWDTDGDGYYDGQEVFNLYNPKGQAPVLLIDSGIVSEYINPVYGYRVYYPQGWQVGAVEQDSRQILFSAPGGDYIELWASEMQPGENFAVWFARVAPGERITDLTEAVNRFAVTVQRRSDDLTAYVVSGRTVYVFIYNPREVGPVAYRRLMNMMTQSFRPGAGAPAIEPQPVLPSPATSAAPVSQPVSTPAVATSSEPIESPASGPAEP